MLIDADSGEFAHAFLMNSEAKKKGICSELPKKTKPKLKYVEIFQEMLRLHENNATFQTIFQNKNWS